MKSRILLAAALLLFASGPVFVQSIPQVAVLDALLSEDFDPAVKVPVTDRLIEELVNSRKFLVLDRDSVEQVLREKEFQLSSGLVKNEEIRQAGEYLGADFVVVARVSKLGNTYFMSARMVDVKTGAIFAQTSDQRDGPIEVLLEVARRTGTKLAGGVVEESGESQPAVVRPPRERPAPPPAVPPPPPPAAPAAQRPAELPGVVGARFGGSLANVHGDSVTADTLDGFRYLLGAYMSVSPSKGLGMLMEISYSQKGYDLEGFEGSEHFVYREYLHYLEMPLLLQIFLPLGGGSRLYLSGGGYLGVLLSADWEQEGDSSGLTVGEIDTYNTANDLDFGVVAGLGVDLVMGGLVLNLDARYSKGLTTVNSTGLDIRNQALTFSVGLGSRM